MNVMEKKLELRKNNRVHNARRYIIRSTAMDNLFLVTLCYFSKTYYYGGKKNPHTRMAVNLLDNCNSEYQASDGRKI